MDLGGGEIGRAVQRQQVVAVQIHEAFECLAALQVTEDLAEAGSQIRRIDGIEDITHLGVAGDAVDAVDGAEVVVGVAAALIESQQDGSLSENIAKADIRTSAKGNSTLPDRGSGTELKMEWRSLKRMSAERCCAVPSWRP